MIFCSVLFIHSYNKKITQSLYLCFNFFLLFPLLQWPVAFFSYVCLGFLFFAGLYFVSSCIFVTLFYKGQFYGPVCCSLSFCNATLTSLEVGQTISAFKYWFCNLYLNSSDKSASSNSVIKLNIPCLSFCLLVSAIQFSFLLHVFKLWISWQLC